MIELGEAIRRSLEIVATAIVAIGAAVALSRLLSAALARRHISFNAVRLEMARYLAVSLEFLLGADIVQSIAAPDWPTLGKLATIATLRTALNFFLAREMREERELASRTQSVAAELTTSQRFARQPHHLRQAADEGHDGQ